MDKQKELKNVIDLFTEHFIKYLNFPPLASKIYAILMVSHREEGIGFNELIKQTNSSKSSVSTNLNFLNKANKVTSYTEGNSRKRLFKAISLVDLISDNSKIFNSEKRVTEALAAYVEKYEDENYKNITKAFFDLYINHTLKIEELIKQTQKDFNSLYLEIVNSKNK